MNPFANVGDFESLRIAALSGESDFQRQRRRLDAGDRRALGLTAELHVAARVRRMVDLAVAAHTAVLLVGPPGTGKTELLAQVIADARNDPGRYGLSGDVDAQWVTPEEEWSFETIVLGQTVQGTELVSTEGHLLEAIRTNQWLVLDEANRADLDRVLGGVLTWLTEKRVKVGVWLEAGGLAVPVYLDWSREDDSKLVAPEGAQTRDYVAGRDWRLLGTYNPADAQRVFRMGQALGRRFKHVPILPPRWQDFLTIIRGRITREELLEPLGERLAAIYRAHGADVETQIGPGLLVDIPRYVEMAYELPSLATILEEEEGQVSFGALDDGVSTASVRIEVDYTHEAHHEGQASVGTAPDVEAGDDVALGTLLAEAYLMSLGVFLLRRGESIEALGERMLAGQAFTAAEWDWITSALASLQG